MVRTRKKSTGNNTQPRKPGFKKPRNNKRPDQHLKQSSAMKQDAVSYQTSSADHTNSQSNGVVRRPAPKGARVEESLPVILETAPTSDYA